MKLERGAGSLPFFKAGARCALRKAFCGVLWAGKVFFRIQKEKWRGIQSAMPKAWNAAFLAVAKKGEKEGCLWESRSMLSK